MLVVQALLGLPPGTARERSPAAAAVLASSGWVASWPMPERAASSASHVFCLLLLLLDRLDCRLE